MNEYTEKDIGQATYAASIHDTTHEGKSIVYNIAEKICSTSFRESNTS